MPRALQIYFAISLPVANLSHQPSVHIALRQRNEINILYICVYNNSDTDVAIHSLSWMWVEELCFKSHLNRAQVMLTV